MWHKVGTLISNNSFQSLHFQETVDYATAQAQKDLDDLEAEERQANLQSTLRALVPSGEDEGEDEG